MPSIEQVLEQWKKDARIDETNLVKELIRTPMYHADYLEQYMYFRAKLASTEKKLNRLKFIKRKYYRGELTRDELKEYGWEQFQGLKPSASELNSLFDMDPELCDIEEQVQGYKTAVSSMEYIMKEITQRNWLLKTLVEYQKFQAGN